MTSLWIDTLARTLLHSLWEGAAAGLALATILCFLRSPQARYAAGCVAMLVILCGLLVTFIRLMPEQPIHSRLAGSAQAPAVTTDAALPPIPMRPLPTNKLTWLVLLWMTGVLGFHLRGVMGWMAARRLRRTGVCVAADAWQERLQCLSSRLGLADPVALWESCLADVPLVVGYLRPVILMPVGLLAGLPTGQVEAILLHELAHIRRYDYLVNLAQVFVEGLLFYHPAVWWISGTMRREREHCCDDLAVQMTGGALEYATALTALEQRRINATAAMAAAGGSLVNRVQRVLGRPEPRYAGVMPVVTAVLLALAAVTAVLALQVGSDARGNTAKVEKPVIFQVAAVPLTGPVPGLNVRGHDTDVERPVIAQAEASPLPAPVPATQSYGQQTLQPDKILFDRAITNIQHGQYLAARLTLNTLINSYPNSVYLTRAKLAIADSWRLEGDAHGLAQAAIEYKDFILFYPGTPEAKEAEMMLSLIAPYKQWLNEDVVYIITDEERKAFSALTTDEEREKFVEQFWLRRDPTPSTERNEFKEEHYRRIAYANEHFGDGKIAGWRTDRGRVYIRYGPPDEIEDHGGPGVVPPFEDWRYRWIEGAGQNVVMEFVDQNRDGEFKMTTDPTAK